MQFIKFLKKYISAFLDPVYRIPVASSALSYYVFINRSVKYSLVYAPLSSLILLMLWLYFCSCSVYAGSLFNIVLEETRCRQEKKSRQKIAS